MTAVLLRPEQRWVCPNCQHTAVTHKAAPLGAVCQEFHPCRAQAGMLAPMVPDGMRCKVVAVEREDWIGQEMIQTDGNGRPVMAIVTTRDDGTDCMVFAPTARGKAEL